MKTRTVKDENGLTLAVLYRPGVEAPGINFATSPDDPLQVGVMNWEGGHHVEAHYHPPVRRETFGTPEVIITTGGAARVVIYDDGRKRSAEFDVVPGDILVLVAGGHEFKVLSTGWGAVEVKQGPYLGAADKVRFDPAELEGQIDKA